MSPMDTHDIWRHFLLLDPLSRHNEKIFHRIEVHFLHPFGDNEWKVREFELEAVLVEVVVTNGNLIESTIYFSIEFYAEV